MTLSRTDELMHAVLDGEASAAQVRELEQRLAGDAAARTRFDELRYLFEGLDRVPKAFPPEGLVASVLANIPQNGDNFAGDRQPLPARGVLEGSSSKARGRRPGSDERVRQAFQPWLLLRGRDMNDRKGGLGNRRLVIGGGMAIAAAIVVVATGVYPPNATETAGTIVPAKRYIAPQNAAADVQLGAPGGEAAQGGAMGQAVSAGTNAATNSAVNSGVNNGLAQGVSSGLANSVNGGVNSGLAHGVNNGLNNGVTSGLANGVNSGLANGVNNGVNNALANGVNNGVNSGLANGVNSGLANGVNNGVNNGLANSVNAGVNNSVNAGVNNSVNRAVDSAVNRSVNAGVAK